MEKKLFKIAVLQMRSTAGAYEKNVALGLQKMEEAQALGADLLLFPECFITSYTLPILNKDALADDSPLLNAFCQKARELKTGAVITAFTRGKNKPQNSAFVIDKTGRVLMKYSKVHTCDFADEQCLENGTEFKVCDFHGVKLGVMICYDREYPESARVLMLKGAEIILVPNDCCSMQPRLNALSTRAYENMTGVVLANPPGKGAGCSCAFSPIAWDDSGRCLDMTLFTAGESETGIYLATYDLNALRSWRSSEMMGNTFRKTAAYAPLLDAQIKPPFIRG